MPSDGIIDQMLWCNSGTNDQGLVRLRPGDGGAPDGRNRENIYLEGGIHWEGARSPARSNDVSASPIVHARTSNALRRLGADIAVITGMPNNIRQHETVIEVTSPVPDCSVVVIAAGSPGRVDLALPCRLLWIFRRGKNSLSGRCAHKDRTPTTA